MGTLVLICAVLAAMAAGVLLAYGVCYAMFSLFRTHARYTAPVSQSRPVGKPQVAEA